MKNAIIWSMKVIGQVLMIILLAPFLIPAYGIARLLGADPFDMDSMGLGFLVTAMIAGGLAIATVFFGIGTLL